MFTEDLNKLGAIYVDHFCGVYALDELKNCKDMFYPPPSRFIVNTHTHNLAGEHWIAINFEKDGIVYAFDPLGFSYPLRLSNFLKRLGNRVVFNYDMHQIPILPTCGLHCILWLMNCSV